MPSVDNNILLKWILKPTFYKQFCAGETGAETQATMKHLKEMGFRGTILTYAKEIVFDHATGAQHGLGVATSEGVDTQWCESIEAWRAGTVNTVELLGEGDQLAVKYVYHHLHIIIVILTIHKVDRCWSPSHKGICREKAPSPADDGCTGRDQHQVQGAGSLHLG